MTRALQVGPSLELPLDAVTQTVGVIGQKGSGKTYLAGKFVEELYDAGAPVIVIDPVGNWGQGLRLAADGRRPGLPIPVLGGLYGDVPLSPDSGAAVARFILDRGCSVVLDVSGFRQDVMRTFVADFGEELFHLEKRHRRPTMVVFEEAQLFAPQHPSSKEAHRVLDAVVLIVRLGRNYGIGSMLITQRPQSVSKEVLNQVECLFVGKLNGRHERKAIDEWIVQNVDDEDVQDLVRQLPSLKTGDMMLWSPSWLETFRQVRAGKKKTFDASATPKLGKKHLQLGERAAVDLSALQEAMDDFIAAVQAEDPVYLQGELSALKVELAERDARIEALRRDADERVKFEVEAQTCALLTELNELHNLTFEAQEAMGTHITAIERRLETTMVALGTGNLAVSPKPLKRPRQNRINRVYDFIASEDGVPANWIAEKLDMPHTTVRKCLRALVLDGRVSKDGNTSDARYHVATTTGRKCPVHPNGYDGLPLSGCTCAQGELDAFTRTYPVDPPRSTALRRGRAAAMAQGAPSSSNGTLNPTELNLLTALKMHHPERLTRTKMGLVAQRSPKSSTVGNAITALVKKGYMDRGGGTYGLTDAGAEHVAQTAVLPTGRALAVYWLERLGPCPSALLSNIIKCYPRTVDRPTAASGTGYSPTSSTVGNALTLLRKMELIDGPGNAMRATPTLVE